MFYQYNKWYSCVLSESTYKIINAFCHNCVVLYPGFICLAYWISLKGVSDIFVNDEINDENTEKYFTESCSGSENCRYLKLVIKSWPHCGVAKLYNSKHFFKHFWELLLNFWGELGSVFIILEDIFTNVTYYTTCMWY